jgi:hypothetical protein
MKKKAIHPERKMSVQFGLRKRGFHRIQLQNIDNLGPVSSVYGLELLIV